MKNWKECLKRACAVSLSVALLGGGVNWYMLKLKAKGSSPELQEYAQDGQTSSIVADDLSEDGQASSTTADDLLEDGQVTDIDTADNSMTVMNDTSAGNGEFLIDGTEGDLDTSNDKAQQYDLNEDQTKKTGQSIEIRNIDTQAISFNDRIGMTNEELLDGYLYQMFYGKMDTYDLGNHYQLEKDSFEEKLYEKLKAKIIEAAESGAGASTVFRFDKDTLQKMGLDIQENFQNKDALTAYVNDISLKFNNALKKILNILMADCPYEMYWVDRANILSNIEYINNGEYNNGYGILSSSSGECQLVYDSYKISFGVDKHYREDGNEFIVNGENIKTAETAKANAQNIVNKYASLSDYHKLHAYKEEICNLCKYNDDAASKGPEGIGSYNPWQLIYVFDGNEDTNVVCEGYAKAFAYLCELSKFQSNKIKCIIVTGQKHMWNIVTMDDGLNYVVDVTNCDELEGKPGHYIGYPDKLFLAGLSGSPETDYFFTTESGEQVSFGYDAETKAIYSVEDLTVAGQNYNASSENQKGTIKNKEGDNGYILSYIYNPDNTIPEPVAENFTLENASTIDVNWIFEWYQGELAEGGELSSAGLEKLEGCPKDIGIYTLAVTVKNNKDTAIAQQCFTVEIKEAPQKQEIKKENLTVELPKGNESDAGGKIYYDRQEHPAKVTMDGIDPNNISIKYKKLGSQNAEDFFSDAPVEIGQYGIYVDIPETDNYKEAISFDTGFSFAIEQYETGEGIAPSLSGGTDTDHWASSATLTAPSGYLISLKQDSGFVSSISYDKAVPITDDEIHKNQTAVTYYLKPLLEGGTEAGYSTPAKTIYVYLDKNAPDFGGEGEEYGIHIEESSSWWNELLKNITFGCYNKNQVTIKAKDELSGVKEYYYYIEETQTTENVTPKTKEELEGFINSKEGFQQGTVDDNGVCIFTMNQDQSAVIYAYAVDKAGNRSFFICSDGIIYDGTAPAAPTVSEVNTTGTDHITFKIYAEEPADVYYFVREGGPAETETPQDFFTETGEKKEGVNEVKITDTENPAEITWSKDGLTTARTYTIYAIAKDLAGNVSKTVTKEKFTIPKEKPILQLPTVTGTYGQKISEMQLSKADAVLTSDQSHVVGTWQIIEGQDDVPEVGTLIKAEIRFSPNETYQEAYEGFDVETDITVQPKSITVKANDMQVIYGETLNLTGAIVDGYSLVGNDQMKDLGIVWGTDPAGAAEPGEYKIIGTANVQNYNVTIESGTLRITEKEDGLSKAEETHYYNADEAVNTEEINIASILPSDAGMVTYSDLTLTDDNGILNGTPQISADGKLTYSLNKGITAGQRAEISFKIKASHYKEWDYKVIIILTEKIDVEPKDSEVTVTGTLTYGELVSDTLKISAKFMEKDTQIEVPGTLEFLDSGKIYPAGRQSIPWVFKPNDSSKYNEASGLAEVTVQRRQINITDSDDPIKTEYNGDTVITSARNFKVENIVENDGWTPVYSFTWYQEAEDGKKGDQVSELNQPGTYILQADIAESNNYTSASLEKKVTIMEPDYGTAVLSPVNPENEGQDGWYCAAVTLTPPDGYLISSDKDSTEWENTLTVDAKETGEKEYRYYLKNKVNNFISSEQSIHIKFDVDVPTGSIEAAGGLWNSFLDLLSDIGIKITKQDSLVIQADDRIKGTDKEGSGIYKIEYLITGTRYAGKDGREELAKLSNWKVYEAGTKLEKNETNIVYSRITDKAGNVTYLSSDNILHDDIVPTIKMTPNGNHYQDIQGSTYAYDGAVSFQITAEDTGSGLESVSYQLDQGTEQSMEIVTGGDNSFDVPQITAKGMHTLLVKAADKAENETSIDITFYIYEDPIISITKGSSEYDGQPLNAAVDLKAAVPTDAKVSYSYAWPQDGQKQDGLPTDAGKYWIFAAVAEDAVLGYKAKEVSVEYEITKKQVHAVDKELRIAKNKEHEYTFDVSSMIPEELTGITKYKITSVNGSTIIKDQPVLEGGQLRVSVNAVAQAQEEQIEIQFENPNYLINKAILKLSLTDKRPVSLSGITPPQTGTYNGKPFAYSGIPVWIDEQNQETVQIDPLDIWYESTDEAGYRSQDAPIHAGSYQLTIAVQEKDPVYIGSYTAVFTISKKAVTVTAEDKEILVGENVPSLDHVKENADYTIEGILEGDQFNGSPKMSYTDVEGNVVTPDNSKEGTYKIQIAGFESADYEISYKEGNLDIAAAYYQVTVEKGTVDKFSAKAGEMVTITAGKAPEGQEFDKWTSENGITFANAGQSVTTFRMPSGNVTVTAVYKQKTSNDNPGDNKPDDSGFGGNSTGNNGSGGNSTGNNGSGGNSTGNNGSSGSSTGNNGSSGSSTGNNGSGSSSTGNSGSSVSSTGNNGSGTTIDHTEVETDGTIRETVIKTAPDGKKTETVTETRLNGSKTETFTETAADGTVLIQRVKETAIDGTSIATIREKGISSAGTEISKMRVERTSAAGTVLQIMEKSIFTISNSKMAVTTVKDGKGRILTSTANVSQRGAVSYTGSTCILSGFVTDRIAEEAGTDDIRIQVTVKDNKDKTLYHLMVEKKDLTDGNGLYLYKYDPKSDKYAMVNAKTYHVSDNGSITVRVKPGSQYTLLNESDMKRVSSDIIKKVKLAENSNTLRQGKKLKVKLNRNVDTENIKRITYTTTDKKVASVSKNGIIKAKASGTARIKVKVIMKNGRSKTLTMKVKVK